MISGLPAELAEYPAVEGKQTHIVTGRQLYEDANAGLIRHESINGMLCAQAECFQFWKVQYHWQGARRIMPGAGWKTAWRGHC